MWKYRISIPCENIRIADSVILIRYPNHGTILSRKRCKNYRDFSVGCARHIQMNYRIDTPGSRPTWYHAVYVKEVECSKCIYHTSELLDIRRRHEAN